MDNGSDMDRDRAPDGGSNLNLLFQYASQHKFGDFDKLFSELESTLPPDEMWEAYLMRGQIKLYATDETLVDDLEKAARFDGVPRYPCLCNQWPVDNPNRFIVFSKKPGALVGFLQALPRVREELARWYGARGEIAVRQIQCEIHYFMGKIKEALGFAEEQRDAKPESHTDAALALCLLFRCYLALGLSEKAENCMLELIRLSRAYPECLAPYQVLRGWANLTTGWSGDTPRYGDPDGDQLPILDDRLEAIRMGFARATPLEEPFVKYAERSYEAACMMRQYYMDIFHAMYWFQQGDNRQAESYFIRVYHAALATDLLMPFAEYGKQIIPLLQHIKDTVSSCPRDWIAMVISLAEQYEKSLVAYRD